ncbi:hypothetical protein NL108_002924, partial [Boleophthalmus pectinirostris]
SRMTEIQQGCVVEVLGLPQSVDDELLALYFENKRRSGGGPLVSVDKRGDSAILVFEEAEAAARVLSREHHVVHNAELSVRKPASKDPCRFLLKGINPSTSIEMIELFVENLMNLNVQDYSLLPSADKRLLLIQLNQPLAQDFQKLSERISKRHLSGAAVTLEHVTETDSVLVENIYPGTTADLISLYFESQRGGGQRVKEVLMLSEGSAKVTFVSFESVNRVLSQPHKLDNTELGVKPYFDFLQPNEATPSPPPQLPDPQPIGPIITNQVSVEQDDIPMQTTPTTTPVLANANSLPPPAVIPDLPIDTVEVMEESQTEEIQITTENIAITDLPKLALFQKSTLAQDIEKSYPNYKITITNNGLSLTGPKGTEMDQVKLDPQYESMLYCREWQEFCQALGCVKVSERGGNLDVLTLKGMEQEKQAAILTFLTTPIERETFIQMEPGRLKYIQIHSHQLLADMTEVSIFPVETEDISGLKIYGHPTACQIAEELLQGLVNEICTKTITVNAPGVTRFWQTDECKKMFNDMETKFQVCIFPEMVPWQFSTIANIFFCAGLINEAKKIVSVIEETPSEPIDVPDAFEDMDDVDLYSAEEPTDLQETLTPQAEHSENPLTPGASGFSPNLEEEAQLSLAIQYSMETSQWSMEDEDTQLQKALELSRQMSQEAQNIQQQPSIRTLQDTIESANTLNLVVFASYKSDLTRVDIAFNKKVSQRQDEQKLEHRCLKYISSFHKTCLDVIRRNHAVKIDIVGTIISVSGFKTYVDEAIPDVKLLLDKMSDTKSDKEILRTVQWDYSLLSNLPEATRVDEESDEFQMVVKNFYETIQQFHSKIRIVKVSYQLKNHYENCLQYNKYNKDVFAWQVDKLMNKLLYSQYQLKKTSVKQSAVYPQVERTLYHGTSESSVKEICVHGFNRSFCGKN